MPNQDVAVREPQVNAAAQPTLMEMVMQAARDPAIDPARLEKFLQLGRELEADSARKEYNRAWAKMMPQLPTIAKNGEIIYKAGQRPTQFARWDDIHPACMPVLYDHGFAVSFDSKTEGERLTVIVIITHGDGHEERRSFTLPWLDDRGAKGPGQAAASALTIGQRHAFIKAFNILTADPRDTGHQAPAPISEEDSRRIEDILAECENRDAGNRRRFMGWLNETFRVERIEDIKQGDQLAASMSLLQQRQRKLGML